MNKTYLLLCLSLIVVGNLSARARRRNDKNCDVVLHNNSDYTVHTWGGCNGGNCTIHPHSQKKVKLWNISGVCVTNGKKHASYNWKCGDNHINQSIKLTHSGGCNFG